MSIKYSKLAKNSEHINGWYEWYLMYILKVNDQQKQKIREYLKEDNFKIIILPKQTKEQVFNNKLEILFYCFYGQNNKDIIIHMYE